MVLHSMFHIFVMMNTDWIDLQNYLLMYINISMNSDCIFRISILLEPAVVFDNKFLGT